MEDKARTFRTKTGTCTITSDRIAIQRSGIRGELANEVVGTSIWRLLWRYLAFGMFCLALGAREIASGSSTVGIFFAALGAFFLWGAFVSRRNSAAPEILRKDIRSIDVRPPRPPLSRGYFRVNFDDDGKERRRLIILPGKGSGGKGEFDLAKSILLEEGLIDSV